MKNLGRHSLCNFVVDKYQEKYIPLLKVADWVPFRSTKEFKTVKEAVAAAKSLFRSLSDGQCYHVQSIEHEQAYQLTVEENKNLIATSTELYPDKTHALAARDYFTRLFSYTAPEEDVVISKYVHKSQLTDLHGEVIRACKQTHHHANDAFKDGKRRYNKSTTPKFGNPGKTT